MSGNTRNESFKYMKILIFLPTYTLTIERGDTTHIKELVSNLSKLAEVEVIVANDVKVSERVPLIRAALCVIQGLVKAVVSIRKKRPSVLYTRGSQAIFAFPLAKLFRLPYIIEINSSFLADLEVETRPLGMRRCISYIKGLLNEKSYKFADHLIVIPPKIKKMLESKYKISPENISVIECGANTEIFKPMNTKKVRRELKLNETYNYICFVGTLYAWQGVECLIRASPYILEECSRSFFLIVGDGEARKSLTKLAEQLGVSDRFIFTRAQPYTSVPLYINASDLCVAPFTGKRNRRTGLSPNKVYEYLACGKPIVTSDIEGVRELCEESKGGICVPADSTHKLANAVVDLLRDPKSRNRMGESGRRYIVENKSWEIVARQVFEVCQMVVQKH